ncbi:MAG TPA: T9SS type A sorting domain-containing protein [Bacteroidia bacterium]|nr:T9SS type A sorting domain-containing protein [Bacteroidia bacterium]
MKKTLQELLLLALLGLSLKSIAQPTLTAAGCSPVIGYATTTVSNAGFPQGASGANQTWNFASIGNTSSANAQYVTVGSTPNGAQFTNCNIASFGGGAYSFYNSTATALTLNGIVSPSGGPVITYSNGEDGLRFPFTYGNTYTDTWAATFTSGVDFFRTGSTTVTADGYGTLITPQGTYTNALRIHFVQTYHDSSDFAVGDYTNDEYFWYKEGIKEALAYTFTFSSVFAGQTTNSAGGGYAAGTVGVENNTASLAFVLAPNPTQDIINIAINDNSLGQIKTRIINQLGQEVAPLENLNYMAGNNMQFDVAYLKNGIYTLQLILEDNSVINKRFTVSK